jgi:hypothetical protein
MDREAAMASELLEIAKATKEAGPSFPGTKSFLRDGKWYDIEPAAYPKYLSLPEQLLRHSKAEKRYSLIAVTTMVQSYIVNLQGSFSTIDNARSKIDFCLEALSAPWPDQTVLHELHGVSLIGKTRPFTLAGARVARFTSTDNIRLTKMYKSYGATIPKGHARDEYLAWYKKLVDALRGTTVVWCSYAAEQTRAEELSLDTMHWVVVLLRYAYMSLSYSNGKTGIGIAAHLTPPNLIVLGDFAGKSVLSAAAPDSIWPSSLYVNPYTRVKMREAGVFVLSSILERSDNGKALKPQSFQFAVLQAVQWAVDSLDQTNNASKILAMTVALETLFSEESFNVTFQVADGTAMVLARDPMEREKISKKMKQLYARRSAVIHGGKTSISDADVFEMQDVVTSVISVICHHVGDYPLLSDFWNAISLAKRSGQVFR